MDGSLVAGGVIFMTKKQLNLDLLIWRGTHSYDIQN